MVESMHGAGPPQSQRVMYQRLGNLPQKIKWAKALAKIKDE
jgi:4-hydroxybutyryl-CoA dehydratase/vinylacetyl-CoA-Delta-isomerase